MRIKIKLIKSDIRTKLPLMGIIAVYIFASNFFIGKVCPIRMALGTPCPGCGITRAFLLLAQGKVYEATIMHPFWIPLVIIVSAFLIVRYFVIDENKTLKAMRIIRICVVVTAVLCLLFYVYRMAVWFPDRAPMVYDADNALNNIRRLLGI